MARLVFGISLIKAKRAQLSSLLFVMAALSFVVLTGCSDGPATLSLSGQTMGTSYHITLLPGEKSRLPEEIKSIIDERLRRVNQAMSTYIPDSELSQLNSTIDPGWQSVSTELATVLSEAILVGAMTGGALDVTVAPLVNLWGFGPSQKPIVIPTDIQIAAARQDVGYEKLQLHLSPPELKKPKGLHIDLSSIAKGYGVDVVAELLAAYGVEDYLVEIGGELRTKGANPKGQPWRIGIEIPSPVQGGVQQAISVSGKAVATSGDYRNFYEEDGVRYSHIIDPRTGKPIANALASVTVVADTAAFADGLATGLSVMGAENALRLAEEQNLAIYVIIKEGDQFITRYSSAFNRYLKAEG
ncbi:FAD:protein FMN transferase [Aurantivibrio plasticivorans]